MNTTAVCVGNTASSAKLACIKALIRALVICSAAYLVVADEAYGRQIPFAFLERIRDEFQRNWAEKARQSPAQSMDKSFGCAIATELAV